ncbi:MAG TPA: hypothetical protein VFA43_12470 [Gemmatimonadaceae bacterium]|nr:hypothetical protein [Gemmatimonadaceae bacterium]
MKRYLILAVVGAGVLGLALKATRAAIERGEHMPNLVVAAAGAVAAAFIIGLNAGRGAGRS